MNQEQVTLSLTNDTKSLLLFNKFLTDANYRELVVEKFNQSYYSEYPIALALSIAVKYFKKYGTTPNADTVKDLVSRVCSNNTKYDEVIIHASIDSAMSLNINAEEDFIRDNIINFVSSVNTYNIILDNIERIKTQKDVSYLLKELSDIDNLTIGNQDLGFSYFGDFEKHKAELSNPEQRLSTGYNNLDKLLTGGWLKNGRMLGLFLAASHVGKSLMLSNLAVKSLKQGKFAVIISLEMSEFVYGTRIDAAIASTDINSLHLNIDKLDSGISKFKRLHPDAELVIKEFAAKTINCRQLTDYLLKLQEKYNRKIDIVYIDYLTLLAPCNKRSRDSLYEVGGNVAVEARAISYEIGCPVISAVQGNRSTFNSDENTGMESVSESIAIAQTADVMITLFQTDSLRAENLIGYEVSKNRLGGMIGEGGSFSVNYSTMTMSEYSSPQSDKSEVKKLVNEIGNELEDL